MSAIEDLVRELEATADKLRAGDLDAAEAAELVDRCADLAGRLGSELERAERDTGEGQGQLL